jgi:hypothetical protein
MKNKMNQKYGALRIISSIMIFMGWSIMVGGGIVTFISFPSLGITSLLFLLGGLFFGIVIFGLAELIYVLIDIEMNTRNKQSI